MENELIARRIREVREDNGLTQEALGRVVGVTKYAVSRWEKGKVENMRREVLVTLSETYGVSALWLMGLDVPKRKQTEAESELHRAIDDKLMWLDEASLRKVMRFIDEFL